MKNGEIVKQGETRKVFTKENIETTFNYPVQMLEDPTTGQTIVVSIPNHMHLEPQKEIRYA
jgi:ABC-type cobalamin/Fe3+-siderophores transport system ATPase subunit